MTSPNSDSSGKWFMFAIIGIFVLGGIGIAAATQLAGGDDPDNIDASATVELSGDSLAQMSTDVAITTADTDEAIGQVAPEIIGTNFAEETVSITADGRSKVVYFMAHWCPHCQVEVPMLTSLVDGGSKPEDLDIYAVSTAVSSARGNYPPNKWLDEEGWTLPVIRDSEASLILAAYGNGGFPYAVYLDGDNKVLFRTTGSLDSTTTVQLWNQAVELASAAS